MQFGERKAKSHCLAVGVKDKISCKKNEQSAKSFCGLFFVIMSRNDVYLRYYGDKRSIARIYA